MREINTVEVYLPDNSIKKFNIDDDNIKDIQVSNNKLIVINKYSHHETFVNVPFKYTERYIKSTIKI